MDKRFKKCRECKEGNLCETREKIEEKKFKPYSTCRYDLIISKLFP